MLAFIDTETYEVRGAQTGDRKDKLTLVTGPADLAKKFTGPQLQLLSVKLRGRRVDIKQGKEKAAGKLWDDVVAQAQAIQAAPPEDLTDVQTPFADAVPDPVEEHVERPKAVAYSSHTEAGNATKRPRLKSFHLHDVSVDISTLPPQAAIIAQGLLKEAKAGVTQMDHDAVVAFLDKLGLKTKQEPWRIFRYYHRNIELLGIISPVRDTSQ